MDDTTMTKRISNSIRIGVLALQGAVIEHREMLRRLGVEAVPVRLPAHLDGLDGLIIPGGESTTIGKLMVGYGLIDPLRRAIEKGTPVYGTCAGLILLARESGALSRPLLGVMDIAVTRNAFGRQLASFEEDIVIPTLGEEPFHAVFIRAPAIDWIGPAAQEIARLHDGTIVTAEQDTMLATAFHPELSDDPRLHARFIGLCARVSGKTVPTLMHTEE